MSTELFEKSNLQAGPSKESQRSNLDMLKNRHMGPSSSIHKPMKMEKLTSCSIDLNGKNLEDLVARVKSLEEENLRLFDELNDSRLLIVEIAKENEKLKLENLIYQSRFNEFVKELQIAAKVFNEDIEKARTRKEEIDKRIKELDLDGLESECLKETPLEHGAKKLLKDDL